MRYNRQDAHGVWHRGSIQSMCTATVSSNMRIVIFKLPVPTGSVGGGSPTPSAAGRAGRDDKRRAGPKAPVSCSFNKNKDSLQTSFCYALFCQGERHRLSSSSDLESSFPSFPSPVTFSLSEASAMKGHIDSWGRYRVEGTFS